jgi:hypothetical protein
MAEIGHGNSRKSVVSEQHSTVVSVHLHNLWKASPATVNFD